ncbi:Hypp939 [Branchiostoma lanceolatum]|uniref:Hypp939 protein n=1 Tax=Branchiostoma lanceolatum TaxID=7740 RepID=A0A8J9ZF42_BRALA|nr:Hypp939 [Branchiostoma lanceolatum]
MSGQGIPFKYIFYIMGKVINSWKNLAGFLGFDPPAIINIKGRNPDDSSRLGDMLGEWRRRKGDEANMGVLMEALNKIDRDREGIVKGLKKNFPELKKEPLPQPGPLEKAMREAAGPAGRPGGSGAGAGTRAEATTPAKRRWSSAGAAAKPGGSGAKTTTSAKRRRKRRSSSKPVVLMINDEYGTGKGGISTIHRGMACLLVSKGAKVYSTVLEATQQDKDDAAKDGVELIFPETEDDDTAPNLKWLTKHHQTYYPHLPTDSDFILGHINITSRAAKKIKEQRLFDAKLVQVTHVIPEDVNHYKSDAKVMTIGDENANILEDLKHADVIFSVGPLLFDYYKSRVKQLKPHYEFLPEPSDIFRTTEVTYVDTKTKGVLSVGRVSGVERVKGYDLAAKSMGEVIDKLPNTKWRARGIRAEDFPESKEIIQANEKMGKFTPLKYGTQEDLSEDMKEAHVVLMPSRAEPFGLVGLEAIAAGVPVLVSHKSGLAWFLKSQGPEFDRLIVEIDDDDEEAVKTLSKRIIQVLKDGRREFQAARRLKEKLLASKYWEPSHAQFLAEFGL